MELRPASGRQTGSFSLFNSPMFTRTGSMLGDVHDTCFKFVAMLPWLGLMGFTLGHVVGHLMKIGSVAWEGVDHVVSRIVPLRV